MSVLRCKAAQGEEMFHQYAALSVRRHCGGGTSETMRRLGWLTTAMASIWTSQELL
jgi:hypothetical protein